MVEKVVKTNFFHDLSLQNGLSRGKCWFLTTFSTFPRISAEVFGIIKMVEKVVKTNVFHDSSRLEAQIVEKFGFDIFSTIFMIPKTSSEIRGKSGKVGLATF